MKDWHARDIADKAESTLQFLEDLDMDEETAAITVAVVLYSLCETPDIAREVLDHVIGVVKFNTEKSNNPTGDSGPKTLH